MADIHQALYYKLANTGAVTDITALAPDGVTEGIYMAGDVQQNAAMPFGVVQQINNELTHHQTGDSKLDRMTFQVNCVAEKHLTAYQLRSAVLTALDSFTGDLGETGSTVAVRCLRHRGEQFLALAPSDGSERAAAQWTLTFEVWHVTT